MINSCRLFRDPPDGFLLSQEAVVTVSQSTSMLDNLVFIELYRVIHFTNRAILTVHTQYNQCDQGNGNEHTQNMSHANRITPDTGIK